MPTAASAWVTPVVTTVLGLFGGGSVVALLRIRVDKNQIIVTAAQGAVMIQSSVIDELQDEIVRIRGQLDSVKKEYSAIQSTERRLRDDNDKLTLRVKVMEDVLRRLSETSDGHVLFVSPMQKSDEPEKPSS